jgi:hypothetical protein
MLQREQQEYTDRQTDRQVDRQNKDEVLGRTNRLLSFHRNLSI